MRVGFTGTQRGMTKEQKDKVQELLLKLHPLVVDHGDCIGADSEFDEIAQYLGIPIRIHPCDIESKRAYCKGPQSLIFPALPSLIRNQRIVDSCEVLIAAPKSGTEVTRSGTWATIRYAKKLGKKVYIVTRHGGSVTY